MSNFMHKMKDAVTRHLHMNKESSHDSSKREGPVNDASNAPKMSDKMEGPGNTMGATNTGTTSYDSTAHDTSMGDTTRTSDNYGSTTAGMGGSGTYGAGGQRDSSKMASGMTDTNPSYGSTGAGMDPANSSTGGYGSGEMNTGSRLNESRRTNEMNPPVNTSIGNRETYGGNMASTTTPMGQAGNTMESGAKTYNMGSSNMGSSNMGSSNMGSSNMGSSNVGSSNVGSSNVGSSNVGSSNVGSSNMANQMENRAQEEMGNLSGQSGFAGAAAGGSSYNAPKPTSKRRSSGPHSSNLLNKLDPRVHSSDYENVAANNQRGD